MSEDKRPAYMHYQDAHRADPTAHNTGEQGRAAARAPKPMTPLKTAQHQAFIKNHPFVRANAPELIQDGDDSEGGAL